VVKGPYRVRHELPGQIRIGLPESHEPFGMFIRQPAKQEPIDNAEDRSVGPDAKRQCNDRNRRNCAPVEQRPNAIADIQPESLHQYLRSHMRISRSELTTNSQRALSDKVMPCQI